MTVETPNNKYVYENRDDVIRLVAMDKNPSMQENTTSGLVYVFSERGGPQWVPRQSLPHAEQSTIVEPSMSKQQPHQNYQTDERGVKPWQMKQPGARQHTLPADLGVVENDVNVGYADQVLVELQKVLESSKVELDTLLKRANHMQEVCTVIEAQINGIKSLKG